MSRPRVLLVHGSVVNGDVTWAAQRPLAERFELVVPNRRGFPPGPDVERVDFEDEAVWLEQFVEPGTHLVGHSYGGVIALFAAALLRRPLRSLTVIEPPCLGVARGHPVVDAYEAQSALLWERDRATRRRSCARSSTGSARRFRPATFSPALLQGARTLMVERYPWEAEIPLDELAADAVPEARRLRRAQRALRHRLRRARRSGSAPSARCCPAPGTRCSASASRSTTCSRRSSNGER